MFQLSQRGGLYEYNTVSDKTVVEGVKLPIYIYQIIHNKEGDFIACRCYFEDVSGNVYHDYILWKFLTHNIIRSFFLSWGLLIHVTSLYLCLSRHLLLVLSTGPHLAKHLQNLRYTAYLFKFVELSLC